MSPAPIRWHEVTALYGGTFDPPHVGHRRVVDGLFEAPGVRAVRVLPSPSPPHKPTIASVEDRIEMCRRCFTETAGPLWMPKGPVTLDLIEIERAAARPGTRTYTFDTLSELRRSIPQLAFVIGTDQLHKLDSWHRFPEVLGLSHWIVLDRKGTTPESEWKKALSELEMSGLLTPEAGGYRVRGAGTFLQVFQTQAPALSSTQVREALARSGDLPEGLILPEVHAYLMKHRLYGTRSHDDV